MENYSYEFGVTLGQATNLALEKGVVDEATVYFYFDLLLKLRASEKFRSRFSKFLEERKAIQKAEQEQQTLL